MVFIDPSTKKEDVNYPWHGFKRAFRFYEQIRIDDTFGAVAERLAVVLRAAVWFSHGTKICLTYVYVFVGVYIFKQTNTRTEKDYRRNR